MIIENSNHNIKRQQIKSEMILFDFISKMKKERKLKKRKTFQIRNVLLNNEKNIETYVAFFYDAVCLLDIFIILQTIFKFKIEIFCIDN